MKHSSRILTAMVVALVLTMAMAAPALAQYEDVYIDDAAAGGFAFTLICCWGLWFVFVMTMLVMWVWMLIDVIKRQEHEFPGSTGSSRTTWLLIVILLGGIGAIVYYFMIYRKAKRGMMQPPAAGGPPAGGAAAPPPPPAAGGAPPPPPPA